MRMIQIHADIPTDGKAATQRKLVRLAAGIGMRRAIWSALHLLGAALFVLAMLTRLTKADTATALGQTALGANTFPNLERPLPSDPHMN